MRIRWRGFELPTRVLCEEAGKSDRYAKFIAEPFERGYGVTVGNSLRRVLLSSLEGAAVTSVRIKGVQHEFSTMDGVVEDVADIILNVKGLIVKMHSDHPKTIRIEVREKGEVTGANVVTDADVEVINKDHHIATLTKDVEFAMDMHVQKGRGYRTAEENEAQPQEIGVIPVDSLFSPVVRVQYRTEDSRVGKRVSYDRLLLEIWTNGTVTPEMALVEAGKILRKHLNPFVQYFEIGKELPKPEISEAEAAKLLGTEAPDLAKKLDMPIVELDLSVRASNCLQSENIKTVRDLAARTEQDMLKIRNFGKTSLKEVKKKLSDMGLSLGMGRESAASKGGSS
jgi:DNA-directed RNA polymerase subunit alpha